ncbi:MAG: hypothetical protein ACHQ1F_12955, partial [Spirochaetia bacterium]
ALQCLFIGVLAELEKDNMTVGFIIHTHRITSPAVGGKAGSIQREPDRKAKPDRPQHKNAQNG